MNAPISSPVEAIAQSTPITTVRDLRKRHSDLLQRQRGSDSEERLSPGEMLGFLEAAQALGKLLEDRAQRENAQGVMDYWTASLLSVAPRAGEQTRPFTLAPFEPGAQTEAEKAQADAKAGLSKAIAAATAYHEKASTETQKSVLHVLRRLVRLKDYSLAPYASPLTVTSSDPDKPVLDALVGTGILVTRPVSASGASTTYDLADPAFLLDWQTAYKIVDERRGFREMARGWDKSGRKQSALLQRGSELDSLAEYSGLDDMEDAFFKASKEGANDARQRELKARRVLVALVIVAVSMSSLFYFYRQTALAKEALAKTEEQARKVSEQAKGEIEGALNQLQDAYKKNEAAYAELALAKKRQDETLAKLEAANKDKDEALEKLKKAVDETEAALKDRDVALQRLREETEKRAKYEQDHVGVVRDLQTVVNLLAPRTDLPPEVAAIIKSRGNSPDLTPQQATGRPLAEALANPDEKAKPQPGIRISVGDEGNRLSGSLGVFVKRKNSPETYLVGPRYLFTGAAGTQIYFGADTQKVIATLTDTALTTHGLSAEVALARVAEGVNVSNTLPGLGTIDGVETQPKPGMKVRLVGSGSGIREGDIVSLEEDGLIKTTRLSQQGDAGAPVVTTTAEGKNLLVGLLYSRSPDEQSLLVPATLLDRYGLELATPAPAVVTTALLQGALGEILVAEGDPKNIPLAQRFVKALLDQGMIMPVPTAQPRRKVPADESEVRCYDVKLKDDPDSIAHRAMKLLIAAGIPAQKIRVSYVEDADAPRNFLQISLARNALSGPRRAR